ncbi:MAG: apolipoprotein N-acyltransferase [Candidatus Omnitrophica bacterium]|nr:apolipoprotein N-acyltransferase [Candidatus Omnitrophota bacterium]
MPIPRDKKHRVICFLVSALLLYLSFPNIVNPMGFSFLIFLFAIPLFFSLEGLKIKGRFFVGMAYGILSYSLLAHWIYPANKPLFFLFVMGLSIQSVMFFCLFLPLRENRKRFGLFYLPSIWALSEWIREQALGGFCWTIAQSLSFNHKFIQISSVIGPYGLSFMIILVNILLYEALGTHKLFFRRIFTVILIIASLYLFGMARISFLERDKVTEFNVCVIQPVISREDKKDANLVVAGIKKHVELSLNCPRETKLIIWPETAATDDALNNPEINGLIKNFTRQLKIPLLMGTATWRKGRDFNSAVLFGADGNILNEYNKIKLIPFAEYYPRALGKYFKKRLYGNNFDFVAGKKNGVFYFNPPFGVLICSEDAYPGLFKALAREGVNIVFVILNDNWSQSKEALYMHLENSILNAVSFGMTVIRSANSGISSYIDPSGKAIFDGKDINSKKVFFYKTALSENGTLYSRLGNIFIGVCWLFAIINLRFNLFFDKKK